MPVGPDFIRAPGPFLSREYMNPGLTVIASSRSSDSYRRMGVLESPITGGITDERRDWLWHRFRAQLASRTRLRSRSNFALPYICRFTSFVFVTCCV